MTRIAAIAATLALLAPAAAVAQPAPAPNPAAWSFAGPTRTTWPTTSAWPETSGRIRAMAVDSAGTLYVAGDCGGVWRRGAGGWTQLLDSQPFVCVGSIAIDPRSDSTIYLGTGYLGSIPTYYGEGILKSIDGGATWTHIVGPFLPMPGSLPQSHGGQADGGARIVSLAVSPTDSNVLLAAVNLHNGNLTGSGVYRSEDGGQQWTLVRDGGIPMSVVFDPRNGNVAYAAIGSLLGDPQAGVHKSIDGGHTWGALAVVPADMMSHWSRPALAIARSNPDVLYVGVSDSATLGQVFGVFKTTNGGTDWAPLGTAHDYCAPFCTDFNTIAVDPADENVVALGGTEHPVWRTIDGGGSWEEISGTAPQHLHLDVASLAFSNDGATLYAGTDGGIASTTQYRLVDPSVTWTFINDNLGITMFFAGFDVHPTTPDFAIAGSQDNGYMLFNGSLTWISKWQPEGGSVVYDSATDSAYMIESVLHNVSNPIYTSFLRLIPGATGSFADPAAFAVDRTMPFRQYAGTNRVYQTTDEQVTWTAISPALTSWTISAIAVAEHNPQQVCAGTSDGHVWCTDNALSGAAATWNDRSAGLPSRYVTRIAINRFKEYERAVAFANIPGADGDARGNVFVSIDSGTTWTDASGNLPKTQVNGLALDFGLDKMLAATDAGVFRTIDGGATWAPVARGLPRTIAIDVAMQDSTRTLYAATMGRSMWRISLPDVTSAPSPTIAMDPWRMRFSARVADPSPASQPLAVMNAGSPVFGSTPLHWSAAASTSVGGPWLSVSPTSGVDAGSAAVAVNTAGLGVGFYNGIVRVDDPSSANGPQDLMVLLEMQPSIASGMIASLIGTAGTMAFTPGVVLLRNAQRLVDAAKIQPACGAMNAFANLVRAQSGKQLTPPQAATLGAGAAQVQAQLGCR